MRRTDPIQRHRNAPVWRVAPAADGDWIGPERNLKPDLQDRARADTTGPVGALKIRQGPPATYELCHVRRLPYPAHGLLRCHSASLSWAVRLASRA